MGTSCEVGKGSSPPAAPRLVFLVGFSAGLPGSHPVSWGMSSKGGLWQEPPTTIGKCCFPASFLHLPTTGASTAVRELRE